MPEPVATVSARRHWHILASVAPLTLVIIPALLVAGPALAETAAAGEAALQVTDLDRLEVKATRIDDAEGGRVGTKMDVPLRETPQSVSVVTRDQMERRGAQTVEEALRYSAGTSLPYGYDQRYDWIDVRGFQTVYDLYRDGLSQQGATFAVPRIDPYAFQRIEVLKGPAGVMYGAGSPGGLINLVSKRPDPDAGNEIAASVGMHDRRELRTDLNGALGGTDSGWRYRLVALSGESETEVDYNFTDKWLLMPSLRWQGERSTLDLQATWQKVRSREGNSVTIAPYLRGLLAEQGVSVDIPRSRFIGEPDFDRFDPEYRTFGWSFEHRFNDMFTLRQNARYNRTDLEYRSHYLLGIDAANPREVTRANLAVDETSKGVVVDTALQAKLGDGRVRHTVLAGIDYRKVENHENSGYAGYGDGLVPNLDVVDPVYGRPTATPVQSLTEVTARQLGFYLQDHIRFDERWVLLLGGRYDFAKTDSASAFGGSGFDDEAFSGRAGLVYMGEGGFAPYIGWSESFQPVNSSDPVSGRAFEPETGRQFEIGARWQPVGADVLLSAAVFDLRKQNMVIGDPDNPAVRSQVGEVRSRGFEAEANTMIAPDTRLVLAATLLDTDTLRGDAAQPTGAPLPRIPEYSLATYLDYTFSGGALDGLNIGAGVRHVGESTIATTASLTTGERLDVDTPSYTVFDAAIHYPWQAWTFSLTGSNLADREYDIGCTELSCYRGYGRRVDFTVRYRW
ncbi:TonB-dependent siderophore receptor [Luteimonas salinilitoris]|uniref:TonB-dependent siderophore receptor n=1 Tax=Luteimonas salinilitoris TaxID=3237697 RepID=A0ABV4HMJ0_9GAMM